ncbi:hexokinase [Exophiala viscosa]|uniref:Phosphotransferase n=1 Tax=Exophiala viscosa TaxID=2486360 RepID=A0AAN6E6C8_9EURO|nr:hexokinase [Exophiala viscosa]KAI1627901.1 hexokinase [Exophiala viscosa]
MTILDFLRKVLRHLAALLLFRSSLKTSSVSPKSSNKEFTVVETTENIRTLDSLKDEIMRLFRQPCNIRRMLSMSSAIRIQYKARLRDSEACMLPSFSHTLPSGQETGTYVSLDVGGSTFRVAIVALSGREGQSTPMCIEHMSTFRIDERIRRLPSKEFFDWMAGSIQATLESQSRDWPSDQPLPVGLAWSFPIEQTSHRSGKMQNMGKGFACHEDTIGMDLGTLIEAACAKRQLNVSVNAIVNDSSATLLSQAYLDPATSMGLILGTGTNAAVYLPTSCMGLSKFGTRDQSWFQSAGKVITNTELSMFGKSILPQTRWDEILNREHQHPDFQPLEYMTTGRYLGELLRLIINEAVDTRDLFDGNMPLALTEPYSLDTQTMARLEQDSSSDMGDSISMIKTTFELKVPPSIEEVTFLRTAAEMISYRASAYMAVAVHALWALQKDVDINPVTDKGCPKTSIACNGSVILKYPGFKNRCEDLLRQMVNEASPATSSLAKESIVLQATEEAAIYGAAVAVALAETH